MKIIFLSIHILAVSVSALSKNGDSGWKSRPLIPELEQETKPTSGGSKQKWDAVGFLKQSSKFVSLPNPFKSPKSGTITMPGDVLWSANGVNEFNWFPLDDVVMGGASKSSFDTKTGEWSGTVTTANNGGFVGIRTAPAISYDMSNCQGLELKLAKSNGSRFKFVVRDSTDFNGVCWTSSFDSQNESLLTSMFKKDDVSSMKIPFENQIPTIFARTVPNQTFNIQNIVGFQLTYSKFEYDGGLNPKFKLGDFSFQLLEVRAY